MPLYCASALICLEDACTCSSSFTRSMGATAVLDTAAATPPASRSFPKDAGSKSRFSDFFSCFFFGGSRCMVGWWRLKTGSSCGKTSLRRTTKRKQKTASASSWRESSAQDAGISACRARVLEAAQAPPTASRLWHQPRDSRHVAPPRRFLPC